MPRQHHPDVFRIRPLRCAIAVSLALSSLTAIAQGNAPTSIAAEAAARSWNLPAAPLADTLAHIARDSGQRLSADPALVAGKTSAPVRGNFSTTDAARQALIGTGLELVVTESGTLSVRPVPPLESNASAMLAPVTVRADTARESAWGPVQGYAAKRSATGTKTDTPIIETPQSISVVGAEEIETLKPNNLMDALNYVAGVARSEGADRTGEFFVIRGFRAYSGVGSMYRDGTKYTVNGFNGQQELYGLERVELLKGASSVLYGTAAPGGIINTVSKRPPDEPLREINVESGSYKRRQMSGDFGGPLSEDAAWTYRLTGLIRDSDSFIDHVPDNRFYIAPALKWQPNAATSFTVLAQHQRDRTAYVAGLPAEGTLLSNPNGKLSRNLFVGEPAFDTFDHSNSSIGYLLEHEFNEQLKLRHGLRHFKAEGDFNYVEVWQMAPDQRSTLSRYGIKRNMDSEATVADTSVQYTWSSSGIVHTTLMGFDVTHQRDKIEQYILNTLPLDLFDPAYGGPVADPAPSIYYSPKSRTRQSGIYVQDQMKIANKWVALLGGRYDWVKQDEENFHTGAISANNERSSAFTGRAGLVYLADNGLTPYASYSQSFQPQSGTDRNGSRFEPTRGVQWELGLRYQPKGSDSMLSAAVYDLTRTNDLVTDPSNSIFHAQLGEVRSRGVELEARSRVGRNVNLIVGYAYTDARTIKSSPLTPEKEGERSDGVPYNQLSVWGDYSFGRFGLPGLKMGAGVRHVDSTRGSAMGTEVEVPSFTLVDAMVSYATGPWRFALNATNLTDKTYVASCTYGCFYGEPRKVVGTVTYKW